MKLEVQRPTYDLAWLFKVRPDNEMHYASSERMHECEKVNWHHPLTEQAIHPVWIFYEGVSALKRNEALAFSSLPKLSRSLLAYIMRLRPARQLAPVCKYWDSLLGLSTSGLVQVLCVLKFVNFLTI